MCAVGSAITDTRHEDRLIPGRVDVWIVTLGDLQAVSERALTRAEDKARFAQIVPPRRKRNFAFRRAALDFVLKRYVSEYTLVRGVNGKPYVLADGRKRQIHFSASSSSNICAIGISTEEIGIDVESRNMKVDLIGICERFLPDFSVAEGFWSKRPLIQQIAMAAWCRIESFVKLRGHTLHAVLIGQDKSVTDWVRDFGHFDVVISGSNYVCAVSQAKRFDISNLYTIEFEHIHREHEYH